MQHLNVQQMPIHLKSATGIKMTAAVLTWTEKLVFLIILPGRYTYMKNLSYRTKISKGWT